MFPIRPVTTIITIIIVTASESLTQQACSQVIGKLTEVVRRGGFLVTVGRSAERSLKALTAKNSLIFG